MANIKISDLPAAVAAQLAMEFEVNDHGTSRRVSGAQIDTLVLGSTNGFVARSGTNQRVARTLTAGSGVVVSHGNGASGNPVIALSASAQTSLAAADTAVQPARSLTAGAGLAGGGDLSANRSFALSAATQASLAAADTAVQPGDLVFASLDAAQEGLVDDLFMSPATTAAAVHAMVDVNALLRTTQFSTYFMGQS